MVAETVAPLLEPCTDDSPCGDNLEYDADFIALEAAAKSEPEQVMGDSVIPGREPDWRDVEKQAAALLGRTKDLRVAVHWMRASVAVRGMTGFAEGCVLVRELIERHWQGVHPCLDPDDDNDPVFRVNALAAINDDTGILRDVRRAPVAESRVFGSVTYRDMAIAAGEMEAVGGDTEIDQATIDAIFADSDPDALRKVVASVAEARSAIEAIESTFSDHVGADQAPDFTTAAAVLRSIGTKIDQRVIVEGHGSGMELAPGERDDAAGSQPLAGTASAPALSGQVNNRDDVIKALDKICAYYAKHEPSSPVPILLTRARRLVPMTFLEIMRDIAPDGFSQAEMFREDEDVED
jgi:type VI secretion system protein ImpA